MKLTLETHGNKYTVETERDDVNISEFASIIKGLLVQAQFHPCTVDQLFDQNLDDCAWNITSEPLTLDRFSDIDHEIASQTI